MPSHDQFLFTLPLCLHTLPSLTLPTLLFSPHTIYRTVNPVLEAAASITDLIRKFDYKKAKIGGAASLKGFYSSNTLFDLD